MQNAVLISLIGMGLVFLAILLLWGLMEILVRITRDRKDESNPDEPSCKQGHEKIISIDKQKIAAMAVAIALTERRHQAAVKAVAAIFANQERSTIQGSTQSGTPPVSGWQSVMRISQRIERQNHFSRKPRGRKL
ncbi:MAG: OadG family protein [Anaerolineaceae bacterium]|nr:OadG family protein [Anaerolineaceae bacterium]